MQGCWYPTGEQLFHNNAVQGFTPSLPPSTPKQTPSSLCVHVGTHLMFVYLLLLLCRSTGEQLFDNNAGQDFTYRTAAGITWEEWQAAALQRQAEQEEERHKAEEVGLGFKGLRFRVQSWGLGASPQSEV